MSLSSLSASMVVSSCRRACWRRRGTPAPTTPRRHPVCRGSFRRADGPGRSSASSWAVACAAVLGDAAAACATAAPRPSPSTTAELSASLAGTSTSTRVLSPSSALPTCWMLRSAAATPSLTASASGVSCVAQRDADGAQADSPQRAGGAAGLVGPGVAGEGQHRAGAGRRRSTALPGGVDGGVGAALHADAVVAVAGDRVDVGRGASACSSMVSRIAASAANDRAGRLAGRIAAARHGLVGDRSRSGRRNTSVDWSGRRQVALAERRRCAPAASSNARVRRRARTGSATTRPCRSW